jgi:hypothetical protein
MKLGRLIVIAVIVVIAIGAVVFRDKLSSNASDLRVGECFEVPTADTVKDVQHRPCVEPHDGEVLVVGDFTGADSYPTTTAFETWVGTECVGKAFKSYTGDEYDSRQDVGVAYFTPTEEGWGKGDHQMICYLTPAGGGNVSTSFAKAPAGS